jgi:hypothetical protein
VITRRIRFSPPRKLAESTTAPIEPPFIIERDDGRYQLGMNDDADGPFESRRHARDAWLRRYSRHSNEWLVIAPTNANRAAQ